jgi:AraC-like DNA-binding protein
MDIPCQDQGLGASVGFMPVPVALSGHVEALVWSRFDPAGEPRITRLMPHGGALLIVGMQHPSQVHGQESQGVMRVLLRHLVGGETVLQTKAQGCTTLFALLKPVAVLALMRQARLGETTESRLPLSTLVGSAEAHALCVALERVDGPQARLAALATWLGRQCVERPLSHQDGRLARAVSLLHERPSMHLDELWSAAGCSRRRLERNLRAWFGTTPKEQQRYSRIQQSARLGWRRQKAVDIALELGFADQAHLSRTINKFTGMTARTFMARMDSPLATAFRLATNGGNLMPYGFTPLPVQAAA